MSNSRTFQGTQRTLQQLSWTVTGLIQIRLCQIQRLFKDHKGHTYSCHKLFQGFYRLGYVNSRAFLGPQRTLQQLSWTVTGLIQIRLCQIQRLFKDHKGHSYSCHKLFQGFYRLGYFKFKGFSMTTRDTPTVAINYFRDSTD